MSRPGVLKVPVIGLEVQELALRFARPSLYPYARFDIDGVEHIPATGAAILVGNHRSYFDVAAMSLAIAKRGRPARFLGKKEVFDAPIVGSIAAAMGGIRVDRGTGSDEPLAAAAAALDGGEMVVMMPEGTIPRGPAFFQKPTGRWGAARLAAAQRRAGDPGRSVGDRTGVAAVEPTAERAEPRSRRRPSGSESVNRSSWWVDRSRPTPSGSWRRSSTCSPMMRTASARRRRRNWR